MMMITYIKAAWLHEYSHRVSVFYRSAGDGQGQFKMPACKPAVPLEDVFSQEEADFETSYLEVIGYKTLHYSNCALSWIVQC